MSDQINILKIKEIGYGVKSSSVINRLSNYTPVSPLIGARITFFLFPGLAAGFPNFRKAFYIADLFLAAQTDVYCSIFYQLI